MEVVSYYVYSVLPHEAKANISALLHILSSGSTVVFNF